MLMVIYQPLAVVPSVSTFDSVVSNIVVGPVQY